MKSYQRQFIEFALNKQVLKFGEFTLKSGRKARISSTPGCLIPGATGTVRPLLCRSAGGFRD